MQAQVAAVHHVILYPVPATLYLFIVSRNHSSTTTLMVIRLRLDHYLQ